MGSEQRKVAFVTGAAPGIGKAVAVRFAEKGIPAALADPREYRGEAVAVGIKRTGAFVKTYVSRPEDVAETIPWPCSEKSSFVTGHSLMVDDAMAVR